MIHDPINNADMQTCRQSTNVQPASTDDVHMYRMMFVWIVLLIGCRVVVVNGPTEGLGLGLIFVVW